MPIELTPVQYQRYSRHLILPEVGLDGQKRLLESSVLIVGAGGLGCPLSIYLAAAGVGTIGLVDFDLIDLTNLQRQILYTVDDVGKPKADVAARRIQALNPDVDVKIYKERLTSENAMGIMADYDIIIDGTDNFPTRYLTNDASVLLGKPNVYGSIFRFEGQASVFDARRGPCYRCLFPEPPPPGMVPSCAEGGVLGILPGTIAMIQATETIKLITGKGTPLIGRLLQYDALAMKYREFKLRKDPKCPVCGENPTVKELIDYEGFCGIGQAQDEVPVDEINPVELKVKLDGKDDFLLLDVREPGEVEIARIADTPVIPVNELADRLSE
ncbi:MAG: molybdopterin-synthase adenylyltransferase MoeB, partial [Deltaproteobacteria bacterium]|nr:molybdopterin-synthase adenylyltransferase MoeB [Deltaproteobacteria bacterium]